VTITVPELWIGACLGGIATLALVVGALVIVARAQRAQRARKGGEGQ
jgi:hypothetical protein